MAAQRNQFQSIEVCCVAEPEQSPVTTAQDPPSNNQGNEPDYDYDWVDMVDLCITFW